MFIIDYPIKFLLEATIPPSDEENYDHKLLILWPIFGGIFISWSFKETIEHRPWILAIIIPIFIGFLMLFLFRRPSSDKSPPKYFWLIIVLALFSSILWNKLCSDLLLAFF